MVESDDGLGLTLRVLDAAAVRARVCLHNIANQNTPGFKRYVVSFEDRLREAHARGGDLGKVYPVVGRDTSGPAGSNNVSVMDELALLDKVQLVQEMFTRKAGAYFARMHRAISGRNV